MSIASINESALQFFQEKDKFMKKVLLLMILLLGTTLILSAQETETEREFILFENEGFIFASYLRAGAYVNSDLSLVEPLAIWNVAGGYNGMRFMNETNYSEWLLAYESPRDEDSWWGGAYLRIAFDIPDFSNGWMNLSSEDYGFILPEAFFRLGFADQDWNLWIGRRYNDKVTVGMMDYYIANLDGNGAGVENINMGVTSMNVHWLFSYDSGSPNGSLGDEMASLGSYPGKQTLAFVTTSDISWGDYLSFIVAPSIQSAGTVSVDTNDPPDGFADTTQDYPFGAGGFLTAKYGRDCFFTFDGNSEIYVSAGFGSGANQLADTSLEAYGYDDWSIFAGFQGSAIVNDTVSFRSTLHYEHRSYDLTVNDWMSFGFRPMVKLTPIFGLQFEYDLEVAFTTGDMVNRITFAPTFTPPGGNVDSGLQVMPFITYGYGDFANADAISIGGSKHGLTFGVFGHIGF